MVKLFSLRLFSLKLFSLKLSSLLGLSVLAIAAAAFSLFLAKSPHTSTPPSGESTIAEQVAEAKTVAKTVADEVAVDSISHPPLEQVFTKGDYRLVITAGDQWETPVAIAQLYEGNTLQWEQTIPHSYGPRFALVSAQGQVLLLDEFINVASDRAVTVISATGEPIAQHSFNDVKNTLSVSAAALTQQASSGWWISAPPRLNEPAGKALVAAGGKTLEIDLNQGELKVAN